MTMTTETPATDEMLEQLWEYAEECIYSMFSAKEFCEQYDYELYTVLTAVKDVEIEGLEKSPIATEYPWFTPDFKLYSEPERCVWCGQTEHNHPYVSATGSQRCSDFTTEINPKIEEEIQKIT